MKINKLNIAILGDGGWGTALAILLFNKGYNVALWGAFSDYVKYLNRYKVNRKFLPGIKLPNEIEITSEIERVVKNKELIIFAVPSQYMRDVLKKFKRYDYSRKTTYLSVAKGIEIGSLKRMSEVIYGELGKINLAVLSGPTIARELAMGIPTAAVIASHNKELRQYLQSVFMTESFRIYTNEDVPGVELGGSLKNVIAIACGISDGLGFGTNTKAALLSRGLAEITRLGCALGAKAGTFSGISGLGDLVTTCISNYSRNRFVGEQIGKGKALNQIKSHMQMPACRQAGVAEGVTTVTSAYALSLKYKVNMPITAEVYRVLYKNKSPLKAVRDLMIRQGRQE